MPALGGAHSARAHAQLAACRGAGGRGGAAGRPRRSLRWRPHDELGQRAALAARGARPRHAGARRGPPARGGTHRRLSMRWRALRSAGCCQLTITAASTNTFARGASTQGCWARQGVTGGVKFAGSPKDVLCLPPGCDTPLEILAEANTPRLLPHAEARLAGSPAPELCAHQNGGGGHEQRNGDGVHDAPPPARPASVASCSGCANGVCSLPRPADHHGQASSVSDVYHACKGRPIGQVAHCRTEGIGVGVPGSA